MKQAGVIFLAALMATAGFIKSHIQDTPRAPSGINLDEAVTVLPLHPPSVLGDDEGIADCLHRAMQSESPTLQFVLPWEFQDALFPRFEPGTPLIKQKELASLLNNPLLQERITRLGLRYVIYVGDSTVQGDFEGFLTGGLTGHHAGLLLGNGSPDSKNVISVIIWDLKEAGSLRMVDYKKTGTVRAGVFIVPFLVPPSAETTACSEIGRRLVDILVAMDHRVTGRSVRGPDSSRPNE